MILSIFAVIHFCLIFIFSSTVDAKSEEATKMEKGKSALSKSFGIFVHTSPGTSFGYVEISSPRAECCFSLLL